LQDNISLQHCRYSSGKSDWNGRDSPLKSVYTRAAHRHPVIYVGTANLFRPSILITDADRPTLGGRAGLYQKVSADSILAKGSILAEGSLLAEGSILAEGSLTSEAGPDMCA
jgi:hypothetical protein